MIPQDLRGQIITKVAAQHVIIPKRRALDMFLTSSNIGWRAILHKNRSLLNLMSVQLYMSFFTSLLPLFLRKVRQQLQKKVMGNWKEIACNCSNQLL